VGEAREGRTWWAAHSVSAYSQKDEIGTKHLDSGQSHRRQCGELVLPMLIVMPGYCWVGMPQRIIISSRSPSFTRTTGATWERSQGVAAGCRWCARYLEVLVESRRKRSHRAAILFNERVWF
jgi:hypothetical protein